MKRSNTPSFITELPLKTTSADEATILIRLDTGRQLYHACLGEALKLLAYIQQSKEYQEIQKLPKTINGEPNKDRTKAFDELNMKEGFTDYDIQHYATGIRNSWIEEHIHAHIAQKLATRAFNAVQKKAFGIAKNVRFKGKNQMDSLEGKNRQEQVLPSTYLRRNTIPKPKKQDWDRRDRAGCRCGYNSDSSEYKSYSETVLQ